MNWVGGSRARIQKNNTGFVPTNQNRRGASQSNRGRGFNNGITSDNNAAPNGQQHNRRLPYSNYDVSCDPRYELVSKKSDAARYRSVPLLEQVKTVFPNGELLSLQLSHQMEIQKVREVNRAVTYQSECPQERRRWSTTNQSQSRQGQEEDDDDDDDDTSTSVSDISEISGATTFPRRRRTNISSTNSTSTRNESRESQSDVDKGHVLSQSSGKSLFPFNHYQRQKENTAETGDIRSLFENDNENIESRREIASQSSVASSTSRSLLSGKTSFFGFNHSRSSHEDDHDTSEHSSETKSNQGQIQLREKPTSSNTSELPSRPTTESREDDTNSRTSSNSAALFLLKYNRIESRVVSRGEDQDHILGSSSEINPSLLRIFENRGGSGSMTPEQHSGNTLFYDSQESLGSKSSQEETSIYFGEDSISNTAQISSSSDTKESESVSSEAQQHLENRVEVEAYKGTDLHLFDEEESSYFGRAVSSNGIKSKSGGDLEGEEVNSKSQNVVP